MILRVVLFVAVFILGTAMMGNCLKREDEGSLMSLVYGLAVSWALAWAVGVPLIIMQKPLSLMRTILMVLYACPCIVGGFVFVKRKRRKTATKAVNSLKMSEMVYLGLFLGILAFQLYKAIFYAYADGDDSYYISVARVAEVSNRMYLTDAYLGTPSVILYRYALAPFPINISTIAKKE